MASQMAAEKRLRNANEVKETVPVNMYARTRSWRGAEANVDGLG
jgi:hypothetical protein